MWLLFNRKLQQKLEYVVDNIIFGPFTRLTYENLWKHISK